ncbi:MAG: alkaline phosphatase family protein [Clostridia bacterium]|nr:alkaline phosphatase family protein [Clostridia bacterium]
MSQSFGRYKRVLMFGIDGMGAYNKIAKTPNMDAVFANGATTYEAYSERPTISGQCWTSMLTGAMPEVHGLSNCNMHPNPEIPTLVTMIRKAHPNATLAVFSAWKSIGWQIIGEGMGADVIDGGEDEPLIQRLEAYLEDHDPEFLFVQLDCVDGAGHGNGYGTPGHLDAITKADEQFGRVVHQYQKHERMKDTLILLSADHGGTLRGSHGAWTPEEHFVFLGVAGDGVLHGQIGEVHLRDYPAIVLWALGIKEPAFNKKGYVGQLPVGVFPDAGVAERIDVSTKQKFFKPSAEPAVGSEGWIGNFLPEEKIKIFINFEDGVKDVSGHCKTTVESGLIKHYSEGIRGQCGELGNGIFRIDNIQHGPVFSLAFWLMCDVSNDSWSDVLTTKDGVHRGFSISAADSGMGIYLKEINSRGKYDDCWKLQRTGDEGLSRSAWTHFIFTVDLVKNRITSYMNFAKRIDGCPNYDLKDFIRFDSVRCGVDHSEGAYKMVDDILLYDGALQPGALKKYYMFRP